jgi:hypothetical protein
MKSLYKQIEDLGYEIVGDIDHGECFCEKDMFYEFIGKLEQLKHLSFQNFKENQECE